MRPLPATCSIVQAIELGATYALAAAYGGIHYDTFRTWMNSKPAFSEAVKKAEGKAAVKWLAKIEAAANDNWQAIDEVRADLESSRVFFATGPGSRRVR